MILRPVSPESPQARPGRALLGRLVRQHDRFDGLRPSVFIDDGDLPLRVGAQKRERALVAQLREVRQQRMRPYDRRGHQLLRLVRGVAEHHPLVARALPLLLLAVHALRDVGTLPMQRAHVGERLPREPFVRTVVADPFHDAARDRLRIDALEAAAGDLAGIDHEIRRDQRLARDVRAAVLREAGIENGIRNLVRHLVGMAFRNRFRREHVAMCIFLHL